MMTTTKTMTKKKKGGMSRVGESSTTRTTTTATPTGTVTGRRSGRRHHQHQHQAQQKVKRTLRHRNVIETTTSDHLAETTGKMTEEPLQMPYLWFTSSASSDMDLGGRTQEEEEGGGGGNKRIISTFAGLYGCPIDVTTGKCTSSSSSSPEEEEKESGAQLIVDSMEIQLPTVADTNDEFGIGNNDSDGDNNSNNNNNKNDDDNNNNKQPIQRKRGLDFSNVQLSHDKTKLYMRNLIPEDGTTVMRFSQSISFEIVASPLVTTDRTMPSSSSSSEVENRIDEKQNDFDRYSNLNIFGDKASGSATTRGANESTNMSTKTTSVELKSIFRTDGLITTNPRRGRDDSCDMYGNLMTRPQYIYDSVRIVAFTVDGQSDEIFISWEGFFQNCKEEETDVGQYEKGLVWTIGVSKVDPECSSTTVKDTTTSPFLDCTTVEAIVYRGWYAKSYRLAAGFTTSMSKSHGRLFYVSVNDHTYKDPNNTTDITQMGDTNEVWMMPQGRIAATRPIKLQTSDDRPIIMGVQSVNSIPDESTIRMALDPDTGLPQVLCRTVYHVGIYCHRIELQETDKGTEDGADHNFLSIHGELVMSVGRDVIADRCTFQPFSSHFAPDIDSWMSPIATGLEVLWKEDDNDGLIYPEMLMFGCYGQMDGWGNLTSVLSDGTVVETLSGVHAGSILWGIDLSTLHLPPVFDNADDTTTTATNVGEVSSSSWWHSPGRSAFLPILVLIVTIIAFKIIRHYVLAKKRTWSIMQKRNQQMPNDNNRDGLLRRKHNPSGKVQKSKSLSMLPLTINSAATATRSNFSNKRYSLGSRIGKNKRTSSSSSASQLILDSLPPSVRRQYSSTGGNDITIFERRGLNHGSFRSIGSNGGTSNSFCIESLPSDEPDGPNDDNNPTMTMTPNRLSGSTTSTSSCWDEADDTKCRTEVEFLKSKYKDGFEKVLAARGIYNNKRTKSTTTTNNNGDDNDNDNNNSNQQATTTTTTTSSSVTEMTTTDDATENITEQASSSSPREDEEN